MRNPIDRAWQDTIRSYGITWGTAIRWLVVPAAAVGLIYVFFGMPEAVSEALTILLYCLAAVVAGFLPLFLWNLWLAPYKSLHDRLDDIVDAQGAPQAATNKHEQRADLNIKLHDAQRDMGDLRRCLEHGVRRVLQGRRRREFRDCEHYVPAIKNKYATWLPSEDRGCDLVAWISKIIAILNIHDYETADSIIKNAAEKGTWDD